MEDMTNKVVVITGCNTGIGKIAALELAKRKAKVIMACRNLDAANAVKNEIIKESLNENIIVKPLNLGSLASVRDFSEDIKKSENKIDILINNAGIMAVPFSLTDDGFESQFGINHLGHFLLTKLLLDLLKAAEAARVVVVSSVMARTSTTDFSDINYEKNTYGPYQAYARSKLANVLFVDELARRLEGSNVTAYSLHPGVVSTNLYRNQMKLTKFFMWPIHKIFMKTPEQGAATTLHCALKKDIEKYSGKYFVNCEVASLPRKYCDQKLANELWEISEKMVDLK